ncbi:bifunctional precorrin-2 dehydrogenase/sirohydrochlorin ferrochelatase [Alicyclobacillus fructus]|uniref:precorrin-2 dehydrogenase/sirohydrochlorin ferrochelatase family protein n=1 Tax=Alicyclobacillus fructus TaxID=2816082 RepID=UPI001A8D1BC6|nr:NAD(P)-dependent oxidoreductase [Alicyclobacillus fructus]
MSAERIPIWLKPRGLRCVVVGGGRVGARRAERLARAGAKVTLVSPKLSPLAADLVRRGLVTWIDRAYQPGDLAECALAVAATDDPQVNRAVRLEAEARGVWCNRADDAGDSDFDFASVVYAGDIAIAISTGGTRPDVAKRLRQALEQDLATGGNAFIRLLRQWAEAPPAGERPPEP